MHHQFFKQSNDPVYLCPLIALAISNKTVTVTKANCVAYVPINDSD